MFRLAQNINRKHRVFPIKGTLSELNTAKGSYTDIGERMQTYADASDVATAYLDYLQQQMEL